MVTSTSRRRAAAALLAAVAGSCSGGGVVDPVPLTVDVRSARWEAVRTDGADQRTLVVAFTGGRPDLRPGQPCWQGYRADVSETGQEVTVTVMVIHAPVTEPTSVTGCTLVGYPAVRSVRLAAPLHGRRVVDGSTGTPGLVFEGRVRRPRFLPAEWSLRSDGPAHVDPAGGLLWQQVWGPPSRPGRCGSSAAPIELTQGAVREVFPYGERQDEGLVHRRSVGRAEGQVLVDRLRSQTTVRWKDRGVGYVLTRAAVCPGDPVPRPELLVRVAESVR